MASVHRVQGETFAGYHHLEVIECGECSILFAMPAAMADKARADHERRFYCPNGHRLSYLGETEVHKLERRLRSERERSGRLAAEKDQLEARRRGQKAAHTRLKNRIANGVCPSCKRSFSNLHDHIQSEHPEYAETDVGV